MRGMLPEAVLPECGGNMIDSYVAVDLETTGLNPKTDKIIEIGAVRVVDGEEKGFYETFVNPYQLLKEEIKALTGIRDGDLEDAPGIDGVLGDFLSFAGELPLLGHHVIFDYSFLKRAAVNLGLSPAEEGIDTLFLARRLMPTEEKKSLGAACVWFGVKRQGEHRALADARAADLLYREMRRRFAKQVPELFTAKKMVYRAKKEQPASKRQKERLQYLIKCHKISLTARPEHLTRNEASRLTNQIIARYGRVEGISKKEEGEQRD